MMKKEKNDSAVYTIFKQINEMGVKQTIKIDGIPIQDYGTVNSRTVYPTEIQIGGAIKSNIDYWKNLYFEEKEKNKTYVSKDKIKDMMKYREFELQQEYKEFEEDVEWRTYKKILEEE